MADSQLILELMFLHIRGGCSLTVLLFLLMLVGTCCPILSASLCVVRPTYRASHRHKAKLLEGSQHHVHDILNADKSNLKFTETKKLSQVSEIQY